MGAFKHISSEQSLHAETTDFSSSSEQMSRYTVIEAPETVNDCLPPTATNLPENPTPVDDMPLSEGELMASAMGDDDPRLNEKKDYWQTVADECRQNKKAGGQTPGRKIAQSRHKLPPPIVLPKSAEPPKPEPEINADYVGEQTCDRTNTQPQPKPEPPITIEPVEPFDPDTIQPDSPDDWDIEPFEPLAIPDNPWDDEPPEMTNRPVYGSSPATLANNTNSQTDEKTIPLTNVGVTTGTTSSHSELVTLSSPTFRGGAVGSHSKTSKQGTRNKTMATHSFCTQDAMRYGVEEAIILQHIGFWCVKNLANRKHLIDGHVWTYDTRKAYLELFPYLSPLDVNKVSGKFDSIAEREKALDTEERRRLKKIGRIVASLESQGAIRKGSFNKKGYDNTLWYTLADMNDLSKYGEVAPEALKTLMATKLDTTNTKASEQQKEPLQPPKTLMAKKLDTMSNEVATYTRCNSYIKNQKNILESKSDDFDAPDDNVVSDSVQLFRKLWYMAAMNNNFPIAIKSGINGHRVEFFGKDIKNRLSEWLDYCTPDQLLRAIRAMAEHITASDDWRHGDNGKFSAGIAFYVENPELNNFLITVINLDEGVTQLHA